MSTNRIKKSMEVCLTCRADAERTMNIHADTANLRRALVAEMDARLIEVKGAHTHRGEGDAGRIVFHRAEAHRPATGERGRVRM